MELPNVYRTHLHHHHHHLGEEKHQMLTLNRRLETYLGHVKLLEEKNELLHQEIHALRHSDQGASSRRKGLEKDLSQARLEVEAAWSKRDRAELELGSLAEELHALGLLRQREAQAQVEAERKLEESRREMEEEYRAQIWLREKVSHLEEEIEHRIRTHEEDVAHLEASLAHTRSTLPTMQAPTGTQVPSPLQLGQEYSQRATRVWQEAMEAYQNQVAQLEESLNQARSRLAQVDQEKSESQLKLQALETERASAQDTRYYLEKSTAQQRNMINQEIQQLQGQMGGLEMEKEELGQQIDALLVDSRGLLQLKMSLSLEVATYRALLDNEDLGGDVSLPTPLRSIYITDAVSSPRGVRPQLTTSHMAPPFSPLHYHGMNGRSQATMSSTTSIWTQIWTQSVALNTTPEISQTTTEDYTVFGAEIIKPVGLSTPYPKILQNGTVEHFRPQDVHEEVSYAEALSPPNEQEAVGGALVESCRGENTAGHVEDERNWSSAGTPEESCISYQAESRFSAEPSFNTEAEQTGTLEAFPSPTVEEFPGFSDVRGNVSFEVPPSKDLCEPWNAWVEDGLATSREQLQEEISNLETDAVLEPAFDTSTSSPVSECEPGNVFNQLAEVTIYDNIPFDDTGVMSQEEEGATAQTNKRELEDKLYPDGEDMDTWDSVIERKVNGKKDDCIRKDESETLHAEPEEDISAREPEHEQRQVKEDVTSVTQQDSSVTFSPMDQTKGQQENAPPEREHVAEDEEDNDEEEEEDSPNLSVSWRTELESDSYAQDNTLADTRPLIRYKSDETDANTQASHMDESESSGGEEDGKVGETGAGTWSESKSNRFGTMEDLCEEAEGELLDEDYDLGYARIENLGVGQGKEYASLQNDKEGADVEMIMNVSEGPSNEETEELNEPANPTALSEVDYNEDLEMVDRLVEQELESLSTATYSVHFAEQRATENESVKEQAEREEVGMTIGEDMFSYFEPEERVHHELTSYTTVTGQSHKQPFFSDISAEMLEFQHEDQHTTDAAQKKEEEDGDSPSMVTHVDLTEDQSIYSDLSSRPESQIRNSEMEESNSSEDESPNASQYSQTKSRKPVSEGQKELLDVAVHDKVQEDVSMEASRGSEDSLKTHGFDPHGLFGSGVHGDFWSSAVETGTTSQPDDAPGQGDAQSNRNVGFDDNLAWGNLEIPHVANGNTKMEADPSKATVHEEGEQQRPSGGKQLPHRDVLEGELVPSEDSEDEGDSWSSGEE